METRNLAECLECAGIGFEGKSVDAALIAWAPHPAFAGVSMKHLIRGADTGGRLSCHLVRVESGCSLDAHVHDGQWELHEVIQGSGRAELAGRAMDYAPGAMCVIPQGATHQVRAGQDGLWLLAKFFPAMV